MPLMSSLALSGICLFVVGNIDELGGLGGWQHRCIVPEGQEI